MTNLAFEARAASVSFRSRHVLHGLDLAITPGRVTVLLGRNGAGKTTLLRASTGSVRLSGGSIRVAGSDAARDPLALRRKVGFVPDRPDVYPWMTAKDLFSFLAPHYRTWDGSEARRLLAAFEVSDDVPFRSLSRGQATKVMLAAALAPAPAVLLLDEPFGGLDPVAREEVIRSVIGELRHGARTVICATHDLDIAARIADDVALLDEGHISRFAPIEDLTDASPDVPASTAIRSLFETAGAPR